MWVVIAQSQMGTSWRIGIDPDVTRRVERLILPLSGTDNGATSLLVAQVEKAPRIDDAVILDALAVVDRAEGVATRGAAARVRR